MTTLIVHMVTAHQLRNHVTWWVVKIFKNFISNYHTFLYTNFPTHIKYLQCFFLMIIFILTQLPWKHIFCWLIIDEKYLIIYGSGEKLWSSMPPVKSPSLNIEEIDSLMFEETWNLRENPRSSTGELTNLFFTRICHKWGIET